nr:RHS repeat-associated core domain-containing protein [uncultured Desulfobacter sp.]
MATDTGHSLTFTYDEAFLTQVGDEVGGTRPTVSYTYNARGQVLTVTDPENKITQNTYDAGSGDLVQTIDDFGGKHITLAWAYDAVGNRTAATDPNGNITTLYYDDLRQMTADVAPSPFEFETRYSYDESGHPLEVSRRDSTRSNQWVSWTTAYTPTFKKKSETDPDGDTIAYEYDAVDRLCKITDPEGKTTRFEYDDAGRLVRKIDANGDPSEIYTYTANGLLASITDGNLNTTLFEYDGLDRLTAKQYPDETRELFTHDAEGNLLEKQTRAGDTITFAYDPLNRLSEKVTPEKAVDFSYDLAGRMLSADDGTTRLSYTYDTAARLVSVARSDGKVIGKAYDDAGNLVQLTYPDGYYLDYSYDSLNRLEDIVEAGTTTLAAYTYDSLSRRSSTTFDNGVTITVSYEPDNDISAMAFQFSDQAVAFDYTYDQAGNRISFASTDDRFVYNPLANETKTYTVNNLNQYTEINTTSPAYDLNGNMISKGSAAFDYDSENRLIEAKTTDTTSSYTSDPMGRRRSKTVNTTTTSYLYDGDNVIMEYDQTGAMARRFVYGPMIDEPVCMITPSARYYYHADALGSVVALSDTSGNLAETYAYSPFGKTNGSSTLGNPYLFTGRRLDSESGLYYYRARHYDAQEGRFVQPDPVGIEGGINLYAYCSNRPLNYIDPDGEVPTLITGAVGAVGGAAIGGISYALFHDGDWNWSQFGGALAGGGVTGGLAGLTLGTSLVATTGGAVAVSAGASALGYTAEVNTSRLITAIGGEVAVGKAKSWSWLEFGFSSATGAVGAFLPSNISSVRGAWPKYLKTWLTGAHGKAMMKDWAASLGQTLSYEIGKLIGQHIESNGQTNK